MYMAQVHMLKAMFIDSPAWLPRESTIGAHQSR
jgi:hypothetical protein